MIDYDFNNNKISCKCYTSYDNKIKAEKKGNVFDKAKINFNVLQCYKNIINLNFKKIYTVIIFMLLSFLLLLFIILMIIYCIRKNKSFKQIIDNIMKNNKTLLKRINILEGIIIIVILKMKMKKIIFRKSKYPTFIYQELILPI